MSTLLPMDVAVRAIRLRESYLLGVVDLRPQREGSKSQTDELDWGLGIDAITEQLKDESHFSPRVVQVAETLDPDLMMGLDRKERNASYQLVRWKSQFRLDRLVLADLSGISREACESISVQCDGLVGLTTELDAEALSFISQTQKHGRDWLGYWRLVQQKALAS